MKWLWTWGGKCYGYQDGDRLFRADGENVGYFVGNEIYSCNSGRYIGELKNSRLITNKSKKSKRRGSVVQQVGITAVTPCDYVGYVMYVGYEDFVEGKK